MGHLDPKRDNLTGSAIQQLLREHLANMFEQSPPESVHALPLEELPMAMFYRELSIGWKAFAYYKFRHLSENDLMEIREDIQNYARVTHSETMTLHPKAIKLFDAMAEVSGIPRKRGEATIDLSPFVKR